MGEGELESSSIPCPSILILLHVAFLYMITEPSSSFLYLQRESMSGTQEEVVLSISTSDISSFALKTGLENRMSMVCISILIPSMIFSVRPYEEGEFDEPMLE